MAHGTLYEMRNTQKTRRSSEVPVWSRLPHEGLGMPVPAVYLPQRSLPPDIRGMWGFEPIATRHGERDIPYASRDGLTLAVDIVGRDAIDLLIVPAAAFTGTGEPARIDIPQLLAAGHFPEPHPPTWKEAAYAAQSLLAVIGPDDLPALDPALARENPSQALAGLWLFKAAIAAVHLVMPGPPAQA